MKVLAKNKRAFFDYEVIETYDAGIVLLGHEVKSIKTGHITIGDGIVKISPQETVLVNMDIPLYQKTAPQTVSWYQPKWPRRLLLTKREQTVLWSKVQQGGLRIIPLEVYESTRNRIKVKIGLAKLKKKVEKKSAIKERDVKREMDKEIRKFK